MPAKKIDSTTLICASPPGQVADHGARQQHQPVGDAADVHQVGGQQEERHRQQDERVVGVEGLLRERHGRQPRLDHQDRQAGERQRERDRHAQQQEQEEQAEQDERRRAGRQHGCRSWRAPRSSMRRSSQHLLAEEDQPGDAGDRPGDVDQPQRQLGELGDAVPGELGELDAGPDEDERDDEHAEAGDEPHAPPRRAAAVAATRRPRNGCSRARRSWRRA